MRILLLGSGAREHALARALLADPATELTVAPGNAGIAGVAGTVDLDIEDGAAVVAYALAHDVDLMVVGPEAPLVAGVADEVRQRGVPVFGPSRAAAALEGSKAFAKQVMADAGVPTGRAVEAGTIAEVEAALDALGTPHVVKADGLAAGKGVLVTSDREEARAHAVAWLERGPVLVEEHLSGREVSLFFVCDGSRAVPLVPAQDHKRLGDGDTGPNTGGMGAFSPVPWLGAAFGSEAAFAEQVRATVAEPVVDALAAAGTPFVGLLYCGLIVEGDRIRVLEFNARFGDPETQVVLARLQSPLPELLLAAAEGRLGTVPAPRFGSDAAVVVVVASEGYPGSPAVDRPVVGVEEAEATGAVVLHAATTSVDGRLVASGGRVLGVLGSGAGLAQAREQAYAGIDRVRLEGAVLRRDIGAGS